MSHDEGITKLDKACGDRPTCDLQAVIRKATLLGSITCKGFEEKSEGTERKSPKEIGKGEGDADTEQTKPSVNGR